MLTSGQRQEVQDLNERVAQLETAVDQVRRQIESVGRQLGDTPFSAEGDRWEQIQTRIDFLQSTMQAMEARLQQAAEAPRVAATPVAVEMVRPAWSADDLDLGLPYAWPGHSTEASPLEAEAPPVAADPPEPEDVEPLNPSDDDGDRGGPSSVDDTYAARRENLPCGPRRHEVHAGSQSDGGGRGGSRGADNPTTTR